MTKKQVRNAIINALQTIDQDTKRRAENELYEALFASQEWQQSQTVGVTLSTGLEINTQPIIDRAKNETKQVVIPKTLPDWQMAFFPLNADTTFEITKFGIKEPASGEPMLKDQIDLIIVPGLGFTAGGERLGFGGGYYDRYLADYAGKTVVIALPQQYFKTPTWPVKDHDVIIDKVIVAKGGQK